MENFINNAPYLVIAIAFFIQYKIFVTPNQLAEFKTDLVEYIANHYVSDKTYRDNHNSLETRMDNIAKDVSDVKTLLISIVQNKHSNN